jgi:hypothetical protein
MAEVRPIYLLELWDANICPNCGKEIPEGTRLGSGTKKDGGFCSLDCYCDYRAAHLTERHTERVALTKRHKNS